MEMKEYMLGLYEKAMPANLSWQEKLEAAKTAGFDFIEMSIDETDEKLARLDMSKEEREAIKAAVLVTGIPIRSICLSGHRKYPLGSMDPKVRAYSLEMMEKAVLLAADLGVRIIQIAGYDVYYDEGSPETEALFKANIAHCAMLAAAEGIVLGFETMETPFMDTVGKAMKYVDAVNSPYLGVYPDSGNLTNAALLYHSDLFADIKSGKGHIVAFHLKETVPGKYREIPFGTGHVDFSAIVDFAWRLGVRRYVAEFWYTGSDSWREDLLSANRFIRQNFQQKIAV
jgi:L-ribulose-5-phosphate 3-epimerase